MKKYTLIFIAVTFVSCEKFSPKPGTVGSVQVINALLDGPTLTIDLNSVDSVSPNNSKVFSLNSGVQALKIYSRSNSGKVYYDSRHTIKNGGIYSAILCGGESNFEVIWIDDSIPSYYTDSSFGVRFFNLSPNNTPVNVTLASDTSIAIFSKIKYKEYTQFLKLPLKKATSTSSVTFQIRNELDNMVLATYILPASVNSNYKNISTTLTRNRNITLIVKGVQGGIGASSFGIFPVANY